MNSTRSLSNVFSCTYLSPKVRTPGRIRIRKTIDLYFLLFLCPSPASFHFQDTLCNFINVDHVPCVGYGCVMDTMCTLAT